MRQYIYRWITLAVVLLMACGCTGPFRDLTTDPESGDLVVETESNGASESERKYSSARTLASVSVASFVASIALSVVYASTDESGTSDQPAIAIGALGMSVVSLGTGYAALFQSIRAGELSEAEWRASLAQKMEREAEVSRLVEELASDPTVQIAAENQ